MANKSTIIKYGLAAAALTGFGYWLGQGTDETAPERAAPAQIETPVPQPQRPAVPSIPAGHYRPSVDIANVWVGASGALRITDAFDRGTCIEVINGSGDYEYAAVKINIEGRNPVRGFMKKDELRAAPECAAISRSFAQEAQERAAAPVTPLDPPAPQGPATGVTLRTGVFLYEQPVHGQSAKTRLEAGDCVKIGEVRPSQAWTQVTSRVRGQVVTGWATMLNVDPMAPCTP